MSRPGSGVATQPAATLFRGWYVVGALFIGGFALYGGGVYSFILFVTPLSEAFHWSHAATGGLVSAFWLSAPLSFLADPLIRRFGVRRLATTGIVIEAISVMLLFTASQLWQMYLLRALAGLGKILYAINLPVILSRWFSRRFGVALAVMYCGWHLGGFALAPVTDHLIQAVGWRGASFALGVSLLLIALPPTLWALRVRSAADMGVGLDGDPLLSAMTPRPAQALHAGADTMRDAAGKDPTQSREPGLLHNSSASGSVPLIKQPAFQLIMAGTAVYYLTYSGVLAHQSAVLASSGLGGVASRVLGATACFAALGALLIGAIIDRFSLLAANVIQYGLMAAGVLCLWATTYLPSSTLLGAHALAFGLAIGGTDVFWITLLKRRIPAEQFQRAWGAWYFLELATIVVAPALAGLLYDLSGSYRTALTAEVAILPVPLALCLWVAVRLKGQSGLSIPQGTNPK